MYLESMMPRLKRFFCQRVKMEDVTKVCLKPMPSDSLFVRPRRLFYIQNGVEKNWDLFKSHDSVAIIIYNKTRQALVFVRQFRPAVYYQSAATANGNYNDCFDLEKYPSKLGITLEMCAGIVDKKKSWKEIAKEEVEEECGYDVPVERIEEVMTFRAGGQMSGCLQKLYYCEVSDSDKTAPGGGVGNEIIEVVDCSIDEVRKMVQQGANNNSPAGCLLGIMWFLANKFKA